MWLMSFARGSPARLDRKASTQAFDLKQLKRDRLGCAASGDVLQIARRQPGVNDVEHADRRGLTRLDCAH